MENSPDTFPARAIAAGVPASLAQLMQDVRRDAEEHEWMALLRMRVADEPGMIAKALADPAMMEAACVLLMATDGLVDDAGQQEAGITDARRAELERFLSGRP